MMEPVPDDLRTSFLLRVTTNRNSMRHVSSRTNNGRLVGEIDRQSVRRLSYILVTQQQAIPMTHEVRRHPRHAVIKMDIVSRDVGDFGGVQDWDDFVCIDRLDLARILLRRVDCAR